MPFGKKDKSPARLCRRVAVTLKGHYGDELVTINAVEVPEICFDSLSAPSLEDPKIREFSLKFPLADSSLNNVNVLPGISLLIGADFYWKLVTNNTRQIANNLMGIETKFGWTIHGAGSGHSSEISYAVGVNVANILHVQCEDSNNEMDITKFWSLKAIDQKINEESLQTNEFLNNNIEFNDDSDCVSLPWIDPNVQIDSNYCGAFSQIKTLTCKLKASDKLLEYDNAIREYMNNNNDKPYVCNRVTEILKLTKGVWRHCSQAENLADSLTRGVKAAIPKHSNFWKNGPDWLRTDMEVWPEDDLTIKFETKSKAFFVLNIQQQEIIFAKTFKRTAMDIQGTDGRVRACEVGTGNKSVLRRPVQLLFPLEVSAAGEDVENSLATSGRMQEGER